jgi:hypothetical protein
MSANANEISPTRGVLPGLSEETLPLASPSTVAETPAHEGRQSPDNIVTHWRRFSSGLWRVPEGDISAAYSAESFPKIKVFTHEGKLFTNGGGHFSGPVSAGADCYLLIPANEYHGPEPRRYTYEGREACFRGEVFRLGPKVVFVATDAKVEEWRQMFRTMYADGGWFARHSTYGLFLNEDSRLTLSENARAALALELTGDLLGHSKQEMQRLLDDAGASKPSEKFQLALAL